MKQQTKNKLILALDSIIALVLSFFFILGVITSVNKVSAQETSISDYYTSEMLEELKIDNVLEEDNVIGQHLLFQEPFDHLITIAIPTPEEYIEEYECRHSENSFMLSNGIVNIRANIGMKFIKNFDYKYFVVDGIEYVYLYITPELEEPFEIEESYAIAGEFSIIWYISEPIEAPSDVPEDEPTVEPEEKSGCGSFFEDVGVVVNELLKIEDTEPFATGMATIVLGGLLAFFALLGLIMK